MRQPQNSSEMTKTKEQARQMKQEQLGEASSPGGPRPFVIGRQSGSGSSLDMEASGSQRPGFETSEPKNYAGASGGLRQGFASDSKPQEHIESMFDGIWGASPYFHTISGATLMWSNKTTSAMQATGERSFVIAFMGKSLEGTLDASGDKISWSDGDVWTRESSAVDRLDGSWADRLWAVHVIKGNVLQSRAKVWPVEKLSSTTLQLVMGGKEYKAFLDPSGTTLKWCDGDIWTRISP